jgi:hypothetical protein
MIPKRLILSKISKSKCIKTKIKIQIVDVSLKISPKTKADSDINTL